MIERRRNAWRVARGLRTHQLISGHEPEESNIVSLRPTPQIDCASRSIRQAAARLVEGSEDAREQAVRIHRFVRDEIKLTFATRLNWLKASRILAIGRGTPIAKTTLFVALLRASSIPARLRFVAIPAETYSGLFEARQQWIDHAIAEIYLHGDWLDVDSHIVDMPLYLGARARLAREGRVLGYGVHSTGTATFNGYESSFAQYVETDTVSGLAAKEFGLYADARSFARHAEPDVQSLHPASWLGAGRRRSIAERRAEALRLEGMDLVNCAAEADYGA